MNKDIYREMQKSFLKSADAFLQNNQELSDEIEEDMSTIIRSIDISNWEQDIDGVVKNVNQLLIELNSANESGDKKQCIGAIAMLRCALADIESAFSNATDSLENLAVSIRDEP